MPNIHRPQGIMMVQTPFRISFFGGGTDFPGFFNQHGGAVIGTAINKYMYVTVNSLQRFFEKRIRFSYSRLENVDHHDDLEHQLAKCILEHHHFFDNQTFLDIHTYADLPASSGVGSSSTFTVGMLNAIYLLNASYKTPEAIAKEAIYIERDVLKDAGGWQDQIFAACGGFNRIQFSENRFFVEPICLSLENKTALEQSCMIFFTGNSRSSDAIQREALKFDEEEKIKQLIQLSVITDRAFQLLSNVSSSDALIEGFGALLHETWQVKRGISTQISNAKIDAMYETGLKAGAFGGKLCGAGGGGFLLLVVPKEKRESVKKALGEYKHLDIQFEDMGTRPIYNKLCS